MFQRALMLAAVLLTCCGASFSSNQVTTITIPPGYAGGGYVTWAGGQCNLPDPPSIGMITIADEGYADYVNSQGWNTDPANVVYSSNGPESFSLSFRGAYAGRAVDVALAGAVDGWSVQQTTPGGVSGNAVGSYLVDDVIIPMGSALGMLVGGVVGLVFGYRMVRMITAKFMVWLARVT